VLYRYRFSPAEKWQLTSADFIEFSKLKPGAYRIQIQAKKYNSSWGLPAKIDFVIRPPFYSTLWFMILAILFLGTCLFFIIRSFLRKKLREQLYALQQKQAIEKERIKIAANIHDDIGAELTNITILSGILKRDAWLDKEESAKLLNKLESSSSQLISKMNDVIWTLNTRNHTFKKLVAHIRNYITSLCEATGSQIRMIADDTAQADLPLTTELTVNAFLITKELLQNAIKHSQASRVQLTVMQSDRETMIIKYEDNGIGFDSSKDYEGNGLYNIRRRTKESRGEITAFSEVNKGCNILVEFPLN
jgi:signal transduction histidine kinase